MTKRLGPSGRGPTDGPRVLIVAAALLTASTAVERARTIAGNASVPPSTLALGYVGLGERDAAFDWWNRAIEVHDPLVMPIKSYAFFDPVRGDPRYAAMLRRMNLVQG